MSIPTPPTCFSNLVVSAPNASTTIVIIVILSHVLVITVFSSLYFSIFYSALSSMGASLDINDLDVIFLLSTTTMSGLQALTREAHWIV